MEQKDLLEYLKANIQKELKNFQKTNLILEEKSQGNPGI